MRTHNILCASLLAAGLALPLAAPAHATVVIAIDKSTQHMTVSVDGSERYSWPVSTGRPGYETPNGTFKPNRMDADHFSQEWDNAPMPHSIFFDTRGHAVHGFFDVKHLGLPVSHGCVRLAPANATVLFNLVEAEGMANTTVVVSGRTPGGNGLEIAKRTPDQETIYGHPTQLAPGYGQQPPAYGQQQPGYGQQSYDPYGRQRDYDQQQGNQQQQGYSSYGRSYFPQQPPPVYGGQSYYGQPYYQQQPSYGYQQYRPYSQY